jgi:hypothetical protein
MSIVAVNCAGNSLESAALNPLQSTNVRARADVPAPRWLWQAHYAPGESVRVVSLEGVPPGLRNASGEPAPSARVVAALVVLALLVLTAPVVLVPVLGWLTELVF